MERTLKGKALQGIEIPAEGVWSFSFGNSGLTVTSPWRIRSQGSIAVAGYDHGQRFGLPAPVDAVNETLRLVSSSSVDGIAIDPETADLRISFQNGCALEVFHESSGHEGWNIASKSGVMIVAMGGGEIAIWENLPPR
jgi:murein DD-endopeptidase MepM/ murein hydrolase activator NlpD